MVAGGSIKVQSSSAAFSPMIVISIFDSTSLSFDVANTKAFTLNIGSSNSYSVDKLTVYDRQVQATFQVIGLGVNRAGSDYTSIQSSSTGHLIYIINLDAPASPCPQINVLKVQYGETNPTSVFLKLIDL